MHDSFKSSQELLEEISALKQKIIELEQAQAAHKQAEEALQESEERYHAVYDQSPIAIELYDANGVLIHVNPKCLSLFGIDDMQVLGGFSLFTDPNIDDEHKAKLLQGETIHYQAPFDFEKVKTMNLYPTSREGVIWLDVLITPMRSRADSITGFLVQIQDATERNKAEDALRESEEKHRLFIESLPIGLYRNTPGPQGHFIMVNTALARMHGFDSVDEFLSRDVLNLYVDPAKRKEISAELVKKGFVSGKEVMLKRKDGTPIWGSVTARAIRDKEGKVVYFDGNVTDITDRKRMEAEILALSITDQLTGLYNRRGFLFHARQQLKLSERNKNGLLLFFADLDSLKNINDTLGHEEGDKALIEAANIIKETFRASDIIARLGGDEFAVLAINIKGTNHDVLTYRLNKIIDIWNSQEGRKYVLSISMGCSCYDPENPCSIDDLIARADKLMYERKQDKKRLLPQDASLSSKKTSPSR